MRIALHVRPLFTASPVINIHLFSETTSSKSDVFILLILLGLPVRPVEPDALVVQAACFAQLQCRLAERRW